MENFQAFVAYLQDPETLFGILDPFYAAYLIYGLVRGLFRGLPEELAQLLGTLLVFAGARMFYQPVSEVMIEHTKLENPDASLALAYLLMVLLFFVAWRVITILLKKAIHWTCPEALHRPGGALLGLAKSTVILCLVLTAVTLSGHTFLQDHLVERSWFGRTTQNVIPEAIEEYLPDGFPGRESESPHREPPDGSGDA